MYVIALKQDKNKMINNLSEFEVKFYQNFAVKFVTKYIEEGRLQAGVYAVSHIKQEKHTDAKPFIDEEFLRRGYIC